MRPSASDAQPCTPAAQASAGRKKQFHTSPCSTCPGTATPVARPRRCRCLALLHNTTCLHNPPGRNTWPFPGAMAALEGASKRPAESEAAPGAAKAPCTTPATPRSTYEEIVGLAYAAAEHDVDRSVLYEEHHAPTDAVLVPASVHYNTSAPQARGLTNAAAVSQEFLWRWTPGACPPYCAATCRAQPRMHTLHRHSTMLRQSRPTTPAHVAAVSGRKAYHHPAHQRRRRACSSALSMRRHALRLHRRRHEALQRAAQGARPRGGRAGGARVHPAPPARVQRRPRRALHAGHLPAPPGARPHAPASPCTRSRVLRRSRLRCPQVAVPLDGNLLRDTVIWDVAQPYNTPEVYAAAVCEDLGLRYNWFCAISAHMQQLLSDVREVRVPARCGTSNDVVIGATAVHACEELPSVSCGGGACRSSDGRATRRCRSWIRARAASWTPWPPLRSRGGSGRRAR